jgi:hypothetical protein
VYFHAQCLTPQSYSVPFSSTLYPTARAAAESTCGYDDSGSVTYDPPAYSADGDLVSVEVSGKDSVPPAASENTTAIGQDYFDINVGLVQTMDDNLNVTHSVSLDTTFPMGPTSRYQEDWKKNLIPNPMPIGCGFSDSTTPTPTTPVTQVTKTDKKPALSLMVGFNCLLQTDVDRSNQTAYDLAPIGKSYEGVEFTMTSRVLSPPEPQNGEDYIPLSW